MREPAPEPTIRKEPEQAKPYSAGTDRIFFWVYSQRLGTYFLQVDCLMV